MIRTSLLGDDDDDDDDGEDDTGTSSSIVSCWRRNGAKLLTTTMLRRIPGTVEIIRVEESVTFDADKYQRTITHSSQHNSIKELQQAHRLHTHLINLLRIN